MDYEPSAAQRIREWKISDPALYDATVAALNSIKNAPQTFGAPGLPPIDRLYSYGLPGRSEMYCITWNGQGKYAKSPFIATVSTHQEIALRVKYQFHQGLDPGGDRNA